MQCDYFDAHACRSCTLMGSSYAAQVAAKQQRVEAALGPGIDWLAPFTSAESGFRNKAKLVVGGAPGAVKLGITDVDLQGCGLYEPGLSAALPRLAAFVNELGLVPYDVPRRSGELKYVIATHSPDDELMVRFVLRSREQLGTLTDALRELDGFASVVSANLHPEHKAVLDGDVEIVLTGQDTLPMRVNDVTLHLHTRSFFQTNTAVAAGLYSHVANWVDEASPSSVWDLYCGVGGFALHCVAPGRRVVGVEVSEEAVEGASRNSGVEFVVGDATSPQWGPAPDLVVVNPPRRGLGADLTSWLDGSGVPTVLYSSCNVDSLARDLANLPSYAVDAGRLFDMFPQTEHHEVAVRLVRR